MKKLLYSLAIIFLFSTFCFAVPGSPPVSENPDFDSVSVGTTGSITEETNTMTFDDGDGLPITLQTIRDGAGGADGTAIHDDEANEITAITAKTTPVDADEYLMEDSAAAFVKKAVTWANIKATLKTYNDSLYSATGALLDAGTDNIDDTHINWGSGAGQVDADDLGDGSTNAIPTLTQESNWDTAYGWGDHGSGGYQADLAVPSQSEAETGTATDERVWTAERVKQAIAAQAGGGTDDQTIDALSLGGTTLSISLEDDGEAAQTVDLAALQDGTGTDDQTAAEVSIADGGSIITGTTVETATQENRVAIDALELIDNWTETENTNAAYMQPADINTVAKLETVSNAGAYASDLLGAANKAAATVLINPMTTAGDIIYGGASGVQTRLAESGTDAYVLAMNTATHVPYWKLDATGAGGSGSVTTIKEDDAGVGGADIETIDFLGADFDLAESPDTEIQVVIAAAIMRDAEINSAANLETKANLGAYASDILGCADQAALITLANGGATALDDIGDPDAATTIGLGDGETITINSAEDAGTVLTINMTDNDAGGDLYGLDIIHAGDANNVYRFLRLYDNTNDLQLEISSNGNLDTEGTLTSGSWILSEYGDIMSRKISDTAATAPEFNFQRGRTTADDVLDDVYLGEMNFKGYHTDEYSPGATIRAIVDGTPGEDDMPTRLEFLTSADASDTPTLRWKLDSAGDGYFGDGGTTNYVKISAAGAITLAGSASFTGNITGDASGSSGSCTGNAATVTNVTPTTALTVNTGTVTLTGHADNDSVVTIGKGAVGVSGSNTGDNTVATTGDSATAFFSEGTIEAARIPFAAPGAIGGTTPAPITGTTGTFTGAVSGGIAVRATISTDTVLTDADIDGGLIPLSGDGTKATLPSVATCTAGDFISFWVMDATAKHVDTNAIDLITLRGVALNDGDKASCAAGNAGSIITFYYVEATGWQAFKGTPLEWTDGGA